MSIILLKMLFDVSKDSGSILDLIINNKGARIFLGMFIGPLLMLSAFFGILDSVIGLLSIVVIIGSLTTIAIAGTLLIIIIVENIFLVIGKILGKDLSARLDITEKTKKLIFGSAEKDLHKKPADFGNIRSNIIIAIGLGIVYIVMIYVWQLQTIEIGRVFRVFAGAFITMEMANPGSLRD